MRTQKGNQKRAGVKTGEGPETDSPGRNHRKVGRDESSAAASNVAGQTGEAVSFGS